MSDRLKEASTTELHSLKRYLDEWVDRIERPSYIDQDPVLFMHAFDEKEDQAVAGFWAALMAWGRRDIVINKVHDLLGRMDHRPAHFVQNFSESDGKAFEGFKHRTFKPVDLYWISRILNSIYTQFGSMEKFWAHCYRIARDEQRELINVFHEEFFALQPQSAARSRKHISDPAKNSACKRLYLYLKWAIRKGSPVDVGIMNFMPESELMIPLDVHVARQARALGLLTRKYSDWKAVTELTRKLKMLDPLDPTKYDFALFGIGVSDTPIPHTYVKNPGVLKER